MMHQEYPKVMTHPQERRGTVKTIEGTDPGSGKKFTDFQGTPDMFPPVTVYDPDMEELHRAKGYRPAGNSDPLAFADGQAMPSSGHVHQEYPKWVGDRIVNSAAEEQALSPSGKWRATVAESAASVAARGSSRHEPVKPKKAKRAMSDEQRQAVGQRLLAARLAKRQPPDLPPAA